MMRKRTGSVVFLVLAMAVSTFWVADAVDAYHVDHEVWLIDQSDTAPDGGGTLHIYRGDDLTGRNAARARAETVDLGGAARSLCLAETGTAPRRPHMLAFDSTHSRAIVSFVATGHVLFINARERQPVACVDVGLQAHAAFPAPDDSYVIVANQNGKLLQRIATDFSTDSYALDPAATLDLATCTTPSGAPCEGPPRPDNAPICPVVDATSRFTFVTLRGGGLLVVHSSLTPMAIVAEYDRATVHPNGCGGVEASGKMYINSGGGTAANPLESDLYSFPLAGFSPVPNAPNTPRPNVVFSHDDRGFVDSHGAVVLPNGGYLWVADRAANRIVVVRPGRDVVVNEFSLVGRVSPDPAPDLLAVSPSGASVYASLRGPNPLTGNAPSVNNAVGSTPGLGIIRAGGGGGALVAVAPVSRVVGGVERADPHAIGVRRT
jgi:DNA-binding beta-propeller fold protein YncE